MTHRTVTLHLTDEEFRLLEVRAADEGTTVDDIVARLLRDHLERLEHRDRVAAAADHVLDAHGDAIDRLGQ